MMAYDGLPVGKKAWIRLDIYLIADEDESFKHLKHGEFKITIDTTFNDTILIPVTNNNCLIN